MSGSTEQYCVYDTTTGEIVTWGTTGIGESSLVPFEAGQAVYSDVDNGPFTRWTHYMSGGAPVAYNDTQAAAKRNQPRWRGTWSNVSMSWVDLRPLSAAKGRKFRELVQDWRDADDVSTFEYGGLTFDSDPWSFRRISALDAAVRANGGALPAWFPATYKGNSDLFLTIDSAATWNAFVQAMGESFADRYAHAMYLRDLVQSLFSVVAVNAVTWETGL